MKGKVYKVAVRLAVAVVQVEAVALTKRQDAELEMLRFSLGVIRLDNIMKEYI